MSKMSELYAEIELMLEQGDHPSLIAQTLNCPEYLVYDVLDSIENEMTEEELFHPAENLNFQG